MTISQWHVPVDETTHYWYCIFTSFGAKVDKEEMRRQRLELYELPNYVPRKNKSNDYGFDPHEQAHETYTGMGADINVHDQWACESMGAVQDRTKEHLGQLRQGDRPPIGACCAQAIEQAGKGERPLMVLEPQQAPAITGRSVSMASVLPQIGRATPGRRTSVAARPKLGERALAFFVVAHAIWHAASPRMRGSHSSNWWL